MSFTLCSVDPTHLNGDVRTESQLAETPIREDDTPMKIFF